MNPAVEGKKLVILGTAPTWKAAPWNDPDAVLCGLNDAYLLRLPRWDRWYDLHPFEQFVYRPDNTHKIAAHTIPAGTFIRPPGHIDWLAKQTCPVWIQKPDPRVPHGLVFPCREIEQEFPIPIDSTPAWMLGQAILEGFREIHIYGVHLASEWEYLRQKPTFLLLIGIAMGMGIKVVVPKESPLLQSTHKYAYQPDPAIPVVTAQRLGQAVEAERQTIEKAWAQSRRWWRRSGDPVLRDRRTWLAAQAQDAEQAVQWEQCKKRALQGA